MICLVVDNYVLPNINKKKGMTKKNFGHPLLYCHCKSNLAHRLVRECDLNEIVCLESCTANEAAVDIWASEKFFGI